MRILKLKIYGFKSFAQKAEILFEGNGLTAIVGPNGCGKSNIADAIRWVMGEQRAGLLRMDKMQGVIFSGTEERPAMSMAEVSLIIENDRGLLPSEYTEVMITRRAFSSGESEYLINNQECRLADIRNLFADTGMGANSYSQMDQRMVDSLLSDRADERRTIFEEAAGVSKYKKQRKDAVLQLEKVQADMERIAIDLQHAKSQFRQQERLLVRSQELRKYKNRLKEIDVSVGLIKYAENKAKLQTFSLTKTKSETELESLKIRFVELETKIEEKRLLIASDEEALRECEREVSFAVAEIAKLNEAYIHLQNREKELAENKKRCEKEIEESQNNIQALNENIIVLENELENIKPEIEEKEIEEKKEIDILQSAKNSIENLRIRHRELSNKRLQTVQAESKIKNLWQKTDLEIEVLEERKQNAEKEIEAFSSQIEELNKLKENKESEIDENKNELEIKLEEQSVLENKKDSLNEMLDNLTNQKIESLSRVKRLEFCTANCEFIDAISLEKSGKVNVLKANLEEEREKENLINSKITDSKEQLQETANLIKNLIEEKQRTELVITKISSEVKVTNAGISNLNVQIEKMRQSVLDFSNRITELKRIKHSDTELSTAENELEQVEKEFEHIDSMLMENEQLLKNQDELVNEIKKSLINKKALLFEKSNRLASIREQIQTMNSALILRSGELETIDDKTKSLLLELENKSIQIEKEQEHLLQKENRRDNAKEKYIVMAGDIEEWRSEVREINKILREKEKSVHDLELAIQASEASLSRFREIIFQEYEFDLDKSASEQDFVAIEIEERDANIEIADLREKIKAIGPINATIAEDFEAEREKMFLIETQYNDLSKAKNSLAIAIERLDIVARDRFLDTFRKIQKNYQDVFASLMPGGEALLSMQSDTDPLEAEIEINARPTGKKMRGVRALSGGERALTATSLLFALYMVKPSSYCILDEIDGPLDDANIGRFTGLLRRFSNQTQFIVVTHNKITMAASDRLYGVTQEIKGISKIGSVRLEDINL